MTSRQAFSEAVRRLSWMQEAECHGQVVAWTEQARDFLRQVMADSDPCADPMGISEAYQRRRMARQILETMDDVRPMG